MSYSKIQGVSGYLVIFLCLMVFSGLSFAEEQPVNNSEPIGPVLLLFIIALAGSFGGFVDGLRTKATYLFSFKGKEKNIGFLGDILVGATAAIVIFTVLDSIFKVDLVLSFQGDKAAKDFVKLVAWSVLSGYVGPRLLNPLSEKMIRQLAGDAARDEVSKKLEAQGDAGIYVNRGDVAISEYEGKGGSKAVDAKTLSPQDAKVILNNAVTAYQLGLESNPNHKQALIGKARAHRRLAEVAEFENDTAEKAQQWKNAISALDAILLFDESSPKAMYNRACYLHITNAPEVKVQEDLQQAIALQPGLKSEAAKDEDLQNLKGKSWFDDLVK